MRPSDWLQSRSPAPPAPLAARLRSVPLDDGGDTALPSAIAACAQRQLTQLLARADHSRAIAADLLTIDALVTYACEAATEEWGKGTLDAAAVSEFCEHLALALGEFAVRSPQSEA